MSTRSTGRSARTAFTSRSSRRRRRYVLCHPAALRSSNALHLLTRPPAINYAVQRTLNATYLPQIASEQGWTKEETLESALQKAGFRGALADVWRKGDENIDAHELKRLGRGTLTVQRYRSEKSEVSWQEWVDARA